MDLNHQKSCVQVFRNKHPAGTEMMMSTFPTARLLTVLPLNLIKDIVVLTLLVRVKSMMILPLPQGQE